MRNAVAVLLFLLVPVLASAANLSQLTLDRTSYVGGDNIIGAVLLDGFAGSNTDVALTSTSGIVTVPSKVTVKESDKGATFIAPTGAVSTAATRAIKATLNGVTKTAVFELVPAPTYQSFTLVPNEVVGGDPIVAFAKFTSHAPRAGMTVHMSWNSTSIAFPGHIDLVAGDSEGEIAGTTKPVGAVFTRQVYGEFNGVTRSANLILHPLPILASVALSKQIVTGGQFSHLLIGLTGFQGTPGSAVTLTETSAAVNLASVIVVKDFHLQNIGTNVVQSTQVVPIDVKLGAVVKRVTLTVLPEGIL